MYTSHNALNFLVEILLLVCNYCRNIWISPSILVNHHYVLYMLPMHGDISWKSQKSTSFNTAYQ